MAAGKGRGNVKSFKKHAGKDASVEVPRSEAQIQREALAAASRLEKNGSAVLSHLTGLLHPTYAEICDDIPILVQLLDAEIKALEPPRSARKDPEGLEAIKVAEATAVLARISVVSDDCREAIVSAGAIYPLLSLLCTFPEAKASVAATQCLTYLLYGDNADRTSASRILEAARQHDVAEPLAAHQSLLSILKPFAEARLQAAQKGSDVTALENAIEDAAAVGFGQEVLDQGRERIEAVKKAEEARRRRRAINIRQAGRRQLGQPTNPDAAASVLSAATPDSGSQAAAAAIAAAKAAEAEAAAAAAAAKAANMPKPKPEGAPTAKPKPTAPGARGAAPAPAPALSAGTPAMASATMAKAASRPSPSMKTPPQGSAAKSNTKEKGSAAKKKMRKSH